MMFGKQQAFGTLLLLLLLLTAFSPSARALKLDQHQKVGLTRQVWKEALRQRLEDGRQLDRLVAAAAKRHLESGDEHQARGFSHCRRVLSLQNPYLYSTVLNYSYKMC